jgi:RIO kinase 1
VKKKKKKESGTSGIPATIMEAKLVAVNEEKEKEREEEEVEEEEELWSSDSEVGDALDWLDSKDDYEAVEGGFTLNSRRPNAHGGLHSRPNTSTLQPLSNRNQRFANRIRASPLEVYWFCVQFM